MNNKRVFTFVREVEEGTALAADPQQRGVIVAEPSKNPYILKPNGSVEEIKP